MRAFQRCSADSRQSIYAAIDSLLGAFEMVARQLPLDENQQLKQHPRRTFAESRRMATDRKRIAPSWGMHCGYYIVTEGGRGTLLAPLF